MREFGKMYGLNFAYEAWPNHYQGWMKLSAEYLSGKISYDGAYQDGTPVKSDTDDNMLTLRGLGGLVCNRNEIHSFVVFAGLGMRLINIHDQRTWF